MIIHRLHLLLPIIFIYFIPILIYPSNTNEKKSRQLKKTTYDVSHVKFNINNISTFIRNNGIADQADFDSGFEYPKGTGKTSVFRSGFVWGTKVNDEIRVGGSTYESGLIPGKILENGSAEDPNSPNVRVYRVRRDFRTADLNMEAEDENKNVSEIYNQYDKDWNEWPANNGAPFEDIDGNGIFNPSMDIPGILGADQTLWYVANDLDSNQTKSLYGSLPLGIEMQVTIWGYNSEPPLSNVIFKKYLVINKSKNNFNEMYFGIWSDPDLGDAGDDYVGCDTTLNLGYVYNSDNNDGVYDSYSPSIGFDLLQGPIVYGLAGDTAYFKNHTIPGKKNLPMTAFSYPYKHGIDWGDTSFDYQLYNYLQGKTRSGESWPIPEQFGGGNTNFPLSGDPINLTGFYDGVQDRQGDRRLMVCTGPFNMAAGDTQEVVFCQVAAGADGKTDHLGAVYLMKYNTKLTRLAYFSPGKKLTSGLSVKVNSTSFGQEVLLNWGDNQQQIDGIEKSNSVYKFQGYNIYQFPSENSQLGDGKLIATFDIKDGIRQLINSYYNPQTQSYESKVIQNGSDSGIQRFFLIEKDYINNKTLAIGEDYYFGVTFYSVNLNEQLASSLENGLQIIKVVPSYLPHGLTLNNNHGDIVESVPSSNVYYPNTVVAFVVDPTKLTSDEYKVTLYKNGDAVTYSLTNVSQNIILFTGASTLTYSFDCLITDGFILQVSTFKNRVKDGDYFAFSMKAAIIDEERLSNEFNLINVFPNPYYTKGSELVSEYERHVTFTHLPNRAIIRIFNLAGELVAKLEKNDNSQILKWYLMNNNNFLVPSGLYIAYIEMPENGLSKILKLAVIHGELIPNRF